MMKNQNVEDRLSRSDLFQQIPGFIKNSPVGTHFYELRDDKLIFRGANVAADKILETDHNKLIGKTIEAAFPDLVKTGIPEVYKEIARNGISWEIDEIQYQLNSVTRYYKVNAFQTSPGNMLAMFSDITEIKNIELALKVKNEELIAVEEELREKNQKLLMLNELLQKQNDQLQNTFDLLQESEEKFRAAFKTSPDSVNINRLNDGMYLEINEGFTYLTGYTWDDVKGKTSAQINIWYEQADRQRLVDAIRVYGKVINLEAKFRLKNGEIRTGLMSASLFRLRNDAYIMSVTRDIEEIVQARASIRESEERFRQLADNIDDVFWLSEGEKVLYVNPAVERKFGFSKSSITENINAVGKLIHPEDLPVYDRLAGLKRLEKGEFVSRQLRIIDPLGKIRWVWARLFPIMDSRNRFYRIAGIVSDITLQKEIENELRTSKEKAQESDHLKSAFLANLSHEIRTPMNGIIGFSRLLAREEADKDTKNQYVEIINKSSDQLLHLIDDLVDISKIEANQMQIFKQDCKLNQLLDDLYLFYMQLLKQEEKTAITLTRHYKLKDEDSVIITDEFRLRQVLMNLLSNAVKFTHRGHIRFGYSREKRDSLRFFVEDTGIGITKNLAKLIFEPFRQADNKNTREYGGTGLGLSISRGLVKLLGGSIGLKSTPGLGTTFFFTLPYEPVKVKNDAGEVRLFDESALHWEGRSILIVEDDEMNLKFLRELLTPTGLKISSASNGIQAIEETSRHKPDLVVMDIRLPVMNGLDATRKIRQTGNKVPIIAQTAYAMVEDKKACLEAGCNDYISKPIHREVLLSKIAYYLRKSKTQKTV
jgi:PAS domain S-box-containing protein